MPFAERFRAGAGRRSAAIGLALLIEALLLLLLLTLGVEKEAGKKEEAITLIDLQEAQAAREISEAVEPETAPSADERPVPPQPETQEPQPPRPAQPAPPQPVEARPLPPAPPTLPVAPQRPPAAEVPRKPSSAAPKRVYGPPDTGGSPAYRDSERVGTAPNGEALYAASWYREPGDDVLRDYLSTARGPGWGLIACRTAPDYRVEDCVGLDEYPQGSQITRAVLAAAWEFRVRPPRLGGKPQVGSWVRIRIDYGIKRR